MITIFSKLGLLCHAEATDLPAPFAFYKIDWKNPRLIVGHFSEESIVVGTFKTDGLLER
ncbi:hypothetical protein M3226_26050 [Neobacillus cucumis]|uniref:hypothetical protein n=1 Tax=Neobacillus cucumis TaxID=1740721 RepID=UPI00204094CC|nr:hypothetical protein [Neobacillus cucumis]MCM3729085.1 hypothetical protein [Neobacillus cucumis]